MLKYQGNRRNNQIKVL